MAVGDALDQITAELDAQTAQQRQQRRVPAPPKPVPPVTAAGSEGGSPPQRPRGGGPSILSTIGDMAERAANVVTPGLGTLLGFAARRPIDASHVAEGVGAGILRSPVTAAAGIADFAGDVGGAISPKADFRNYEGRISPAGVAFRYNPANAETISHFARDINPVAHAGNQSANEIASNVASLAIGYGAGAKLAGYVLPGAEEIASTLGNPIARTAAATAIRAGGAGLADAIVMDPETERFSNLLQNLGVHTEFTDWLAHDDQEGHLAGRFKNAIEGTGLGAATDGLFQAAGYWRARLRGDNATADTIQGELAAKHDGEVPDYHTTEVPPQAPPTAKEPGYVAGWEDAPDGGVRPVYEKDPTATATPEGKAQLQDDAAGQADEASSAEPTPKSAAMADTGSPQPEITGEAPAADPTDPIVSFNVKRSPNDPGVTVGPIDRGAIDALASDIKGWRDMAAEGGDRELDVTRGDVFGPADRVGEFRLGNIGSTEDVAPLLRSVVDRLPDMGARSDAELMHDAARASAEVGEDPAALLEAARLISGKLSDADTAMATIRTVWAKAAGDLDGITSTNWETAGDEDVAIAAQRIYNMMAISRHVQEAKAGLGRGLRVNQLPDAESYLNTVAKADRAPEPTFGPDGNLPPLPRTRQEIQTWSDVWEATKGDPVLRSDFLEGALTRSVPTPGRYLARSISNFFVASILSAVKTHLLGFTGPVLMSILRNTERLSGGFMASLNPFITASERQANLIAARQASFNYVQALGQASDAMHWASKAFSENTSQLHAGAMFDGARSPGPINPALIEAAGQNSEDIRYMLGNGINLFPRGINRVYNFTDELPQRLAYYGEIRARAIVEGATQGLDGENLQEFVRQKLKASTTEAGAGTNQEALALSQRSTFLGPVGSEGTWVRKVSDAINGLRKDYPLMRYILPVFNVPANILAETIRRTPLAAVPGFGYTQTMRELSGELGPVAQAEAHGRFLTGAAFLTGGYLLASRGLLTGAGPREGTARKVWLMTHQPWSLRVGDSWVRLDRYDVAGALITVPATIFDATQYVKHDQAAGDMALAGIGALAEWFKDRASIRTAAALLDMGNDPMAPAGSTLSRLTAQTAAGFIPNILQSLVTQQLDTTLRQKREWLDYMKAAIPGLSSTLPPVRNVLGEPVERAADTVGEALFPVTIAKAVSWKDDPVIDEIDRLYQSTGYAAGADPTALSYGHFHPQDVTLENGQSLYDAFMEARQHLQINGQTLKQTLGQLVQSPEYQAAVDADPGQRSTSRGDASRGYMVQQVFNAYNKQIKAELAEASPTANQWLTAAAAKQKDDAYLRDVSASDLVANTGYYQSHGIDPAVYSSKVREGATGALVNALREH